MYVALYYLNSVTISVQIDLGKDGQPGSDLRGAWLRPLQPTNWTETLRCHKTSFANILRGRAAEVQAFNKVSNWAQTSSLKNQLALSYIVSASNTLFVFSLSDPKQNARSLLKPVFGTVFMLFHMVALVLLSMVAFLTIFLLAENLQQPIRVFEVGGY